MSNVANIEVPGSTISRTDHAYRTLRSRIISGELGGGIRLRQHQIARELGITTNPLREALMLLKRDGLVELEPNMGARVCEWDPERHIKRLDLRIALESELGMLAAQRATPIEIHDMAKRAWQLDSISANDDDDEFYRLLVLDSELHRAIAEAARSEELAEFWGVSIVVPSKNHTSSCWREHMRMCQPWSHSLLVQAIASRDPEVARRAARRHVEFSRSIDVRLMGLEWQFPQFVAQGTLIDVPEGTFTCVEDILRPPITD